MHGTVVVRGDDAFVRATIEALELLKAKTPDVYALLERHIGDIVSGKPSGVVVIGLARFPTTLVVMGPAYSQRSMVKNAGALAHETYHCELYRRAEQLAPGRPVPIHAYSGEYAETLCLRYQCDVLKRLGLDEAEVDRYERSSLESRWWEVPFDQQSW